MIDQMGMMRSAERFSLLIFSLLFVFGNVKAGTAAPPKTHYAYAVSEDCKVMVTEFEGVGGEVTASLKKATKDGDCAKAAVLHYKGHLLVFKPNTTSAVKFAYKFIEKTSDWEDLKFNDKLLDLSAGINNCTIPNKKIGAFIEFHVLHILVECGESHGFVRSLVFSNGEIRSPPDPVMPIIQRSSVENLFAISADDLYLFDTIVYFKDNSDHSWHFLHLHGSQMIFGTDADAFNGPFQFQSFVDPVAELAYIGFFDGSAAKFYQVGSDIQRKDAQAPEMKTISGLTGAKLVFVGKAPIAIMRGLGPKLNFTVNALADTGESNNETYFKGPLQEDRPMCDVINMKQNVDNCQEARDMKRYITMALFGLAGFEFLSILGTLMIFTLCICRRRRRIKHRKGKGKNKRKDEKTSKNEKTDDKDKSKAGSATKSK